MSDTAACNIRYLAVEEAAEACEILCEASRWTERFSAPAWPSESLSGYEEREAAAAGELVGGFEDGRLLACMRLQRRDAVHWPDDAPGEALYLHRLAIRRAIAGTGWPGRMVNWAIDECRNKRARALRLDTLPDTRLPALYERLGFRLVDQEPRLFAGRRLVRMELIVSLSASAGDL